MHRGSNELDTLVDTVLASPKYSDICKDLVIYIGSLELAKRSNLKEAIKATRNKLHQAGGAYFNKGEQYAVWLDELKSAVHSSNREKLLHVCARIMSYHASTRERLPILDRFYAEILATLPPTRTVLDVACGLHPLAIPWMPLAKNAEYFAYDIYQNMTDFLAECMTILQVQGHAQARDVIQFCPTQTVDVAFLLKTIPCLEQVDKSAGHRLLQNLHANYIVVSFPVHSLGGRSKGMVTHYEARFRELVANEKWSIKRFDFNSELVFLVGK